MTFADLFKTESLSLWPINDARSKHKSTICNYAKSFYDQLRFVLVSSNVIYALNRVVWGRKLIAASIWHSTTARQVVEKMATVFHNKNLSTCSRPPIILSKSSQHRQIHGKSMGKSIVFIFCQNLNAPIAYKEPA